MQSSAAVAGRALIMLACVIGIPFVALSGTSWPDIAKKLQEYHWPAILGLASASPSPAADSPSLSEAPPFGPTKNDASNAGGPSQQLVQSTQPAVLNPLTAVSAGVVTGNILPTNGVLPIHAAGQLKEAIASLPAAVVPAGYQTSAETPPNGSAATGLGDLNAANGGGLAKDPFHAIQEQLRQLGATYYLLESWGNDQQMYRFYCKMAVGGSANYTRCFEATDADPLQAMRQVLREVQEKRLESREAN
jgi:hypothetical protein